MKKTTIGVVTASMIAGVAIGTVGASAATFPEDTQAQTNAKVTVLENDEPDTTVPDPDNPDNPLDPDDPDTINPGTGELRIGYISNFDFGDQMNTSSAISLNAKLVGFTTEDGTPVQRVPFLTTVDLRGDDRTGWTLQVSQPKGFIDEDNHELKGATLNLNNIHYTDSTANTPTATQSLTLNNAEQTIARATAEQGVGTNLLVFGEAQEDGTTNGVTLEVPANTVKNNKEYSSTIVWSLVADPSNPSDDQETENLGE